MAAGRSTIAHRRTRSRPLRAVAFEGARYAFLGLALFFFGFPIYWVLSLAFKSSDEFLTSPPTWWPAHPTLDHFAALAGLNGLLAFKNSLIVASVSMVASVVIGGLAAYSIARFQTGGTNLTFWLLSQRMMPPVVVALPIFLLYRTVHLIDTQIGLIFLYTVFNLPFTVWMLRAYFLELPQEVEDNALVDGCSHFGVLWRIVLPLAAPGVAATAIFAFISSWTEFLLALYLTSTYAVTVPVTLAGWITGQAELIGEISALALLSVVPIFVISLFVQRHFVRGLTMGAVKT